MALARRARMQSIRELEITVPAFFTCPISLELMRDPVITCTGVTYNRHSIEKWIETGHTTCPATHQQLNTTDLTPNHTLRRLIQAWCSANSAFGVERIPTPKTPANPHNVQALLAEIAGGSRGRALGRLEALAKDSVRNTICIAEQGAAHILGEVICDEDREHRNSAVRVLARLPLDEVSRKRLGKELRVIAQILKEKNSTSLETRICSLDLLEHLLEEQGILWSAGTVPGLIDGLINALGDKNSNKTIRSALRLLLNLVSHSRNRVLLESAGAVDRALEILMEKDKGVDEPCLGLLESLCRCAEGRAAVSANALGVPLIVKKMSRSSPTGAELAVNVLWYVCGLSEHVARYAGESEVCAKLFWVLQMDCSPKAKVRASDLMRIVHNACRECPCCFTNSLLENAGVYE